MADEKRRTQSKRYRDRNRERRESERQTETGRGGDKNTHKARKRCGESWRFRQRQQGLWERSWGKGVGGVTRPPTPCPCPRTLLALGCHVGMADEKAEDNLKKTKLPKT